MADTTQGKAQQRDPGSGTNAGAIDKGERAAASRDTAETTTARARRRGAVPNDTRPTADEIAKRSPKTYRALERGYIDGRVVEPGQVFTTQMDEGEWMEPVKAGAKYSAHEAADEAQYARKLDVNYEGMDPAALQALAAMVGVSDPGALKKKDDLIAAIRAARIPQAQ